MILYNPQTQSPPQESEVAALAKRVALPKAAARILINRGMKNAAEVTAFLNPSIDQMLDPFLLPDMPQAADLIHNAISQKKRIFLFGDYDVDGVCAIAILYTHIKKLGGNVEYRVPNRSEGYGLNVPAVEAIAQRADLLITLDCGITALDEIDKARELGLETIVTDHHQCLSTLPQGPVVNAHRPDSVYPFRQFCGTGVALKLIQALSGASALGDYLVCAALATVADIVPLMGENRVIVAEGLKRLEDAPVGLKALMEQSGVANKDVKASHLAFAIAPRLNAAGRLGDATRAIELLTTKDERRAKELAEELDAENRERQAIEQQILKEALEMLREADLVSERAILLSSPSWHQGVTGIVASRLTERFYRPVLLFHEEDELLTASCRSIPGVHLFEALSRFSEYFTRYGGHAQAAGLTIEKRRYGEFKRAFLAHMRGYNCDVFLPVARYDAHMRVKELDAAFVRNIARLEPFGFGNPSPVIRVKGTAQAVRTMGASNTHLRFNLADGAQLSAVGFSMGARMAEIAASPELDVLLLAEPDTYRGENFVRGILRHVKPDTSAPVEVIMKRNSVAFFEAYLNDADIDFSETDVKSTISDCDITSDYDITDVNIIQDPQAHIEEILRGDIAGTLILARTPEGAKAALTRLGELGLRERTELCVGTLPKGDCAYHTLLLAPDVAALSPRGFKRAFVCDSCLTPQAARRLASVCRASGVVFDTAQHGENCERRESRELLSGVSTKREDLGAYYRALRQIAAAAYEYSSQDALFAAVSRYIPAANPKQLLFALRVFDELGFLRFERSSGAKVLLGAESKRTLTESRLFRFIQESSFVD